MSQLSARYTEKVRAPWWMWSLVLASALSIGIAVGAAFGGATDLISGGATFLILAYLVISSTVVITVDDEYLTVDHARLPREFVGEVQALDAKRARLVRGRDADPAAYLVLRGWVTTAVLVTNTDTDDPVPYWFISSRHPDKLAAALRIL